MKRCMVKLTISVEADDDRVADFNYEGELDALGRV